MAKKEKKNTLKQYKKKLANAEKKLKKLTRENLKLAEKLARQDTKISVEEKEVFSLEDFQNPVSLDCTRNALRRAKFLRDRYEHHLGLKKSKTAARQEANQDLVVSFGPESGFTAQELNDVLT